MRYLAYHEMALVAGGTTTLPPVTVTGTGLQSTFTSAEVDAIFAEFYQQGSDDQWDQQGPIEDVPSDGSTEYLQSNSAFLALPTALQNAILSSPTATPLFAAFFGAGGTITGVANITGAQFFDGNPPRIEVSASMLNMAHAAQANGDMATSQYYSNILAGNLAHEIGHFALSHIDFNQTAGIAEYEIYRTRYESLAIYTSLVIGSEMGITPGGYATPIQLQGYFNDYLTTGDWNALMNTLDNAVRTQAWSGGYDVNGDGLITHQDLFLSQYPYGGQ